MSWLQKLMMGGNDDRPPVSAAQPVTVERYGSRVVGVPQIDLIGRSANSPNGRYELVWDRGNAGRGPGRYALVEEGRLVLSGSMDRPDDGKVSDVGDFVLNEGGDPAELSGTFRAFRRNGIEIVCRSFTANLLNNGISPDGTLAVCQTCNSPRSPDSSILTVFDLTGATVIASWTPESGWAQDYEFPGGERIRMVRAHRPPIHYSIRGDFIDRKAWLQDEVSRGTLYVIRKVLEEGAAATGIALADVKMGVQQAIIDEDTRFHADAFRLLGEVEEAIGDKSAALRAYEEALAINPKVGIAKRARALWSEMPP